MSEFQSEEEEHAMDIVVVITVVAISTLVVYGFISIFRVLSVFDLPKPHQVVDLWANRFDCTDKLPDGIDKTIHKESKSDWMLEVFCKVQLRIWIEDFPLA